MVNQDDDAREIARDTNQQAISIPPDNVGKEDLEGENDSKDKKGTIKPETNLLIQEEETWKIQVDKSP